MSILRYLDWRIQAIVFGIMIMFGAFVFLGSSIRSTIASYLYLDKLFK